MAMLTNLPDAADIAAQRVRKGPANVACNIYGDGDIEDWHKVKAMRLAHSWADAQRVVDNTLNIARPIIGDKFRYHWNMRCQHWTDDDREVKRQLEAE